MPEQTHVLVIGGGTAGTACARACARGGARVTVAEPDRLGGTCLWRGCIPKRALHDAARVHRIVRGAETFGTVVDAFSVDWADTLAWKWHAQETYAGDQLGILTELGVEVIRDSAHFLTATRVAIGDAVLEPDFVVIATGSAPLGLAVPGGPLADSSDEALHYPALPASIVIVGSGYVAMEFAGIFASFGTSVSVLSRSDEFLTSFDRETVEVALSALSDLGVTFVRGATVTSIDGVPGRLRVTHSDAQDAEHVIECERVLAAVGRTPSLDSLDIGQAQIELDLHGNPVLDQYLRTSDRHIFVIGDAAGMAQHTPVASIHGRAVASSILTGHAHEPDVRAVPFACFTVPELAQVGFSEAEADEAKVPYTVHRATFEYLGAAITSDSRRGLVKILADEKGRTLLGAHVAADNASDLIYPLALAVRTGATLSDVKHTAAVHPSFAEAINWAAG
ncbi:MAG: NAD(P)/FAD-dependent oxidoreductase [Actinomycetia bacterium]|nr:NAD(P)/FAD-dependent oxidoreductase [Actinomycetes bacterium]